MNMKSNLYEIHLQSIFTINQTILKSLYFPIIGKETTFLYTSLFEEYINKANLFVESNKYEELLVNFHLSHNVFVKLRKTLEAVGLLKTYQKNDNTFVFVLVEPLGYEEFMEHEHLANLLKQRVNKNKLREIQYNFAPFIETTKLVNISEKIDFIYSEQELAESFIFNFTRLFEDLCNHFNDNVYINDDAKMLINSTFANRILNYKKILEIVIDSTTKINGMYETSSELIVAKISNTQNDKKEKIKEKKLKINRSYDLFATDESLEKFQKVLNDYKQYVPEKYISSALKIDVNKEIEQLIHTLKEKYELDDEIINCIIDYVIYKNNGVLQRTYILKIAKTIIAKAINSVEGVIQHLRAALPKTEKQVSLKTTKKTNEDDFFDKFWE